MKFTLSNVIIKRKPYNNIVAMTKPVSSGKTFIDTFSGQSGTYKVFAYIKNPDGSRTYLPADGNPEVTKKVRTLAKALFEAHEAKQEKEKAPHYEIKKIDAQGLIKTDNSIVSHDFKIQPVSPKLATQMETVLGGITQADTVKAQDIWEAFEATVRQGIQTAGTDRPVEMKPEPVAKDPVSSPASPKPDATPVKPVEPPAATTAPAPEAPSVPLHKRAPHRAATSIDLDLEPLP